MRKIFLALAVISFVFLAVSCKKDSDGNTIYKMSATIDGKQWNALAPTGILTGGVLVITGISISGESVIVTVKGDMEKTYELNTPALKTECFATYKASLTGTDDSYASLTGKVILTKVDKTKNLVSGTFEFSVSKLSILTKQITKGEFNDVTFINQ